MTRHSPEGTFTAAEDRRIVAGLGPTHRCPTCGLPYWIERTCDGRYDHATGERIEHAPVLVVPIERGSSHE